MSKLALPLTQYVFDILYYQILKEDKGKFEASAKEWTKKYV